MRTVGRYTLIRQISSSNLGHVFSARRVDSGADLCAVKLLKPHLAKEPRYADLLRREAPAAVRFAHPNVARILEVKQADEYTLSAMELVRGQPLSALLSRAAAHRRAIPRDILLWIGAEVASALQAAHDTPWREGDSRGMFHGEVSPQSVLISYAGEIKLLSVGIGRSRMCLPPARSRLPYRAPELFEEVVADARTDVYGLGVILYDALCGGHVYARESVGETKQAILQGAFEPVERRAPGVPNSAADLIHRMMARSPTRRVRTMMEVEAVLRSLLERPGPTAQGTLADLVRTLFTDELIESERFGEAPSTPVVLPAPGSDSGLWRPTPGGTPPPAISVPEPPRPPRRPSNALPEPASRGPRPSDPYEAFDVDALVDAIVAASAKERKGNFIERTPMPGPLPPEPAEPSPFRQAIERGSSEAEVDALVDAIVHASAKAREVQPRSSSQAPLVFRETMNAQAVVDVALDAPKRRRGEGGAEPPTIQPNAIEATPRGVKSTGDITPPGVRHSGDIMAPDGFTLKVGDVVGDRYRIVEKLGSGGMAVVYRVEHTLLEKPMALKLLRPELSTIPYVVQRFQREARCVGQLDDPRIVRVTDFGRAENGSLYLVMELIEGQPLSRRLDEQPVLPFDVSMHIIEEVLLGLEHAHKNNVIHRDLKPDNIMLVEREGPLIVKIVDFGIAKLAGDAPAAARPLTQAGMVFGSPRYMSPEQASAEAVDSRADIYAAGVILYELLTGKRPFDGKTASAILSRSLTQPPPPMNLLEPNRRAGRALEMVVNRALAKEKEDRFATAGAFLEAIRAALRE